MAKSITIIGAGIVGLGAAWQLAERSWQVTVCEQFDVFAGASGGAIGALVPYPPHRAAEAVPKTQRDSIGDWPVLAGELGLASRLNPGYRPIQRWQLCKTPEQAKQAQLNEEISHGIWQYFTQAEAQQQSPAITFPEHGAALCHDTGCVDTGAFKAALLAACQQAGVKIQEYAPVADLNEIDTDYTLIAGGAWASQLQDEVDIKPVLGQALRLHAPDHGLNHMIRTGRFYLIPQGDEIWVGSTLEAERNFARLPTEASYRELKAQAIALYPKLAGCKTIATFTGHRPKALDGKPVVKWLESQPNIAIAAGHYGIGYGLLPWTLQQVNGLFADKS